VFVQKRLALNANYQLARSVLSLEVFHVEREYQESTDETDKTRGVLLSFDWDAMARTRFGANVRWEVREFDLGGDTDYGEFGIRMTREFTRTVSGGAWVSHFFQNSDFVDDFRANQVSLFVEARF
jgi:uncharacterized protein (PEP-CTERM system associated)